MLPATAPFYMGLAAGWAVFVGTYVHHTGTLLTAILSLRQLWTRQASVLAPVS